MNSTLAIPGLDRLVARLDAAVACDDLDQLCGAVREVLHEELAARRLELPEEVARPAAGTYARRLVYACPRDTYTVLAMVWGPGQGTLLHDHGGLWCVEGVLTGQIEVVQYDLTREDGGTFEFVRQGTVLAGVGDAGALIPPFEYHTIANPDATDKAVTIHVYGGELLDCHVFRPLDGQPGQFVREARHLSYTD